MLIECKSDKEKVAMGLLSYLPDFKNLANLKEEINLNKTSSEFQLYLYRGDEANFVGVIGTQNDANFIIIRYLSFAPDYRNAKCESAAVRELAATNPKKKVTALPEWTYLLKYLIEDKHHE
ncbi:MULTISPECIES: reductase [unclassified Lactobacillus]|uniref:reductase n=1 Tax=unclassified Lactobacillus TaxID=2620435 RepID=UPI0023F6AFA9|nr:MULTISPECIES: reductase [unclassified Lactobacillus]MDF7668381.1 reductase [Lactobacillus sp. ESL0703]WEV39395.1 reductase [Lactobacillus sp. ESL0680]